MNLLFDPENRLIALSRKAKRLPSLPAAILLSLTFLLGAGLLGGIPAYALLYFISTLHLPDSPVLSALQQMILLIFSFGPIFIFLWGWMWLYEKRPLWTIGLGGQQAPLRYLRGLAVGFVLFSAVVAILAALGMIENNPASPQFQGLPALGGVLLVLVGWVIQGPGEEGLCRGWLMQVIGARYRPITGVVVSSLVFAAFHSLNPHLNPLAILNLVLFGLFSACYALTDGSLWGVFACHSIWNWAEGNLFGFAVSGMDAPGGTLFRLSAHGSEWITGGGFGPEGGLAVSIVLLVGLAYVLWISARKTKTVPPQQS